MIAQFVKFGTHLLGVVLLSRMLSPAEIGLVAIGWAIVGLGEILRDFGLSASVVRSQGLTVGERSNLFWVNALIGVVLATGTAAIAPVIAWMFETEALAYVLLGLAPVFLLNGLSAPFRADLNRRMRFARLSVAEMLPPVIGLIGGLLSAAGGWGYWAIVIQYVIAAILSLVLLWALAHWIPLLPNRKISIRHHLQFGWRVSVSQAMSYAATNVDTLALGYMSNPAAVGVYSRGFQLAMSPLLQLRSPANIVAVPVLARSTNDLVRFERTLRRGGLLVGYTVLPIAALMVAAHEPIVSILLGAEWVGVAPVLGVLAAAGGLQQVSSVANWTFLTLGDGRHLQRYSLLSLVVKCACILPLAPYGALAVSLGYLGSVLILWPVAVIWSLRASGIPVRSILLQSARVLFIAFLGSMFGMSIGLLDGSGGWAHLLLSSFGCCAIYLCGYLVPSIGRDIRAVGSDLWRLVRR